MKDQDIRWLQRFSNYKKALRRLEEAVTAIDNNRESENLDLLKEGLIQRFEFTHELAWKVMKDYLEYQGHSDIRGSRDAFRKALAIGIINNPAWIDSIQTRNITSHTYDEDITNTALHTVITEYLPIMLDFEAAMTKIEEEDAG